MSRLSFRPRPLDIHKKLPILKSVKDFEDDDTTSNTRNHIIRLAAEAADVEVCSTQVLIIYCIPVSIGLLL